jgi:hypothetical protein
VVVDEIGIDVESAAVVTIAGTDTVVATDDEVDDDGAKLNDEKSNDGINIGAVDDDEVGGRATGGAAALSSRVFAFVRSRLRIAAVVVAAIVAGGGGC